MKTAEAKSTRSAAHLQARRQAQPFFQKEGGDSTLIDEQAPFFSRRPVVQTKLTIGRPGDRYEQEADQTAENVINRLSEPGSPAIQKKQQSAQPALPATALIQQQPVQDNVLDQEFEAESDEMLRKKPVFESAAPPEDDSDIQRACTGCHEEETVQAKSEGAPNSSSIETQLKSTKGSGSPLPADTRRSMEHAFGSDFSGVRVHTGSDAARMNKELGAHAFTHGSDIYFNSGKYDARSEGGQKLLAHELTHTLQQGASPTKQTTQAGGAVLHLKPQATNAPLIQLQEDDSPGFFDRVGDFASDVVGSVGDTIGSVVDSAQELASGLIDSVRSTITGGIERLNGVWEGIREFADTAMAGLRERADGILSLFMSPLNQLANAVLSFNAENLLTAWSTVTGFASSAWAGVTTFFHDVTSRLQSLWENISSLATSFFSLLSGYTSNPLFEYLQAAWETIVSPLRAVWDMIQRAWTTMQEWVSSVMLQLTESAGGFIQSIISFPIESVVSTFRSFGQTILAIQEAARNPMAYVTPLIDWIVNQLQGTPEQAIDKAGAQFQGDKREPNAAGAQSQGIIMMQEEEHASEARSSVGWNEFWSGVWRHITQKWGQISLWDVVVDTLWTFLWPWPGVWQDTVHMYDSIKAVVGFMFSPNSWQELWTGFLRVLDIGIIVWRWANSVLGRLWGWLFIASVIAGAFPGSAIGGFLASVVPGLGTAVGGVGGGLLGAGAGAGFALAAGLPLLKSFLAAEAVNMLTAILSLTTGLGTRAEKERDFGRIAESALGLAAAGLLWVLTAAAARLGATLINFARRFVPRAAAGAEEFLSGARRGYRQARRPTTVPDEANSIATSRGNILIRPSKLRWLLGLGRRPETSLASMTSEEITNLAKSNVRSRVLAEAGVTTEQQLSRLAVEAFEQNTQVGGAISNEHGSSVTMSIARGGKTFRFTFLKRPGAGVPELTTMTVEGTNAAVKAEVQRLFELRAREGNVLPPPPVLPDSADDDDD